jgi:hypothetical protein
LFRELQNASLDFALHAVSQRLLTLWSFPAA